MLKLRLLVCALLIISLDASGQETAAGGAVSSADDGAAVGESEQQPLLPEVGKVKPEPIFPNESSALIAIEAEDAVSTNLAKEPTLNYGASAFRTLQLSRYTALAGGAPFFAEFVFYVEREGTYEFWYGGTPPGPREDLFPSYASPFVYRIDDGAAVSVYRENVTVFSGYTPAYYWVRVGDLEFDPGIHTIRFEITEKRRFDGKYFFYLDSLFFVDREAFDPGVDPTPEVFPKSLDGAEFDQPFRSIVDYEYLISQNPDDIRPYIELSLIYSLIGDYNNALKNLNRAALIAPSDPEIQLLSAKNRIWKGDAAEGLRAYRRLLETDPSFADGWAEAGKVAAWIGKYRESIRFYRSGLRQFPDDLNLIVNLGITYLWDNQPDQAEVMFDRAETVAFEDVSLITRLGSIYLVNGYPDLAIKTFRKAIGQYPEYLVLYLALESAYAATGRPDDAERIHSQIADRFVESAKLSSYLDTFAIKQRMKENLIAEYQRRLEREPDNLALRELLVQTYFWNGLRRRAIEENLNILTNYAYRAVIEFDSRNADLLETVDRLHVYGRFLSNVPQRAGDLRRRLAAAAEEYVKAVDAHERYLAKVAAAREKGEAPPSVEGVQPAERRVAAENDLANLVREIESYIDWVEARVEETARADTLVEPFLAREQDDREAFALVTASVGWEWDRRATVGELQAVSENGVVLADYILSRIYQMEGDYDRAIEYAQRALDPKSLLVPAVFALNQAEFWADIDGNAMPYWPENAFVSYQEYVPRINETARRFGVAPTARAGLFSEGTYDRARDLGNELDRIRQVAQSSRLDVEDAVDALHTVLENRLRRLWYRVDQDTYLLRFELGDYYLLEKEYRAAIAEFRKVLRIDPWNTSATFKLGTLYQLAGDWRKAMEKYRQVYFADPKFENVAGNYNDLARAHADSLAFENYLMADSSRIGYHAQASFTNNLSGAIGLDFGITSDTVRRTQAYGGVLPDGYQINAATVSVPITFSRIQTTLRPKAGVEVVPTLLTGSVTTPANASNPVYVMSTYAVEPTLGFEAGANVGPLYLGGVFTYGRVAETYYSSGTRVMSRSGEINAVLSLGFLDIPLLAYSSARTYAKIDLRLQDGADPNLLLTFVDELNQVFHIRDNPWTNLTLTGTVVFERASDPTVDAYYAPDDVLNLKGGLNFATWIGVGNGNVLGISVLGNAGLYTSRVFDPDAARFLSLETQARIEFTKGESTYYATLAGSATFDEFPSPEYWSVYLRLGYTAKLPRLLAE